MKRKNKAIFTAAITGSIHTPTMSPYLPITPKQIADEAVRSCEAGAAVAHIHVRIPDTGQPSPSLDLFREVITEVKSRCNIVLCLTTGGSQGMTVDQRVAVVPAFKPEMATCNFGSMNFAYHMVVPKFDQFKFPWEVNHLSISEDYLFPNTFKTLREFLEHFKKNNTKPELEVYDVGMINNVAHMIEQGHLQRPVYLQFVMGILGGIPATIENLVFLYQTAKATLGDFVWSAAAAGRNQMKICTTALLLGGNTRVGLEDSVYVEKGRMAKSNAEQVVKVIRIAKEFDVEPATPDEAREILGLKGLTKVNY
jgi:uncharacterized protein (DUF849 family)